MHHDQAEIAALRKPGQRLTSQRLLTLDILKRSARHLTAKEIHEELAPSSPAISIVTVYRTLQWLQAHGLASEIDLGGGCKYYEYTGERPHHHLICQDSHEIVEIDDAVLDSLKEQIRTHYGYEVRLDHLAISGRCLQCREST